MNFVQRMDEAMDLELSKKILFGLSAAAFLVVPIDGTWIYLEKTSRGPASVSKIEQAEKTAASLQDYQAVFKKNTIFGTVEAEQTPVLQTSIAEMAKDYRLKGVVFLGEPEAILEDARTQKTFFVKTGQAVDGLTVKEIKEGFLLFSCLGEEIKLEVQ